MGVKIVKETIYLRINSLNQQLTQEAVIQEAVILRFYLFKTRLYKVRLMRGSTSTKVRTGLWYLIGGVRQKQD